MTWRAEISATMRMAVLVTRERGKLVRFPGGYWSYEGCPWDGATPQTYFGTTTIQGLVRRGVLRYSQWRRKSRQHGEFPVEAVLDEAAL
jgi:hypothetical protein